MIASSGVSPAAGHASSPSTQRQQARLACATENLLVLLKLVHESAQRSGSYESPSQANFGSLTGPGRQRCKVVAAMVSISEGLHQATLQAAASCVEFFHELIGLDRPTAQ